jgi:hypothetical protein
MLDDTFDYAGFLPELGPPLPFTLMTTWHDSEPLEETLEFAFCAAHPPDDLAASLDSVVVVVDSDELEERCRRWLQPS